MDNALNWFSITSFSLSESMWPKHRKHNLALTSRIPDLKTNSHRLLTSPQNTIPKSEVIRTGELVCTAPRPQLSASGGPSQRKAEDRAGGVEPDIARCNRNGRPEARGGWRGSRKPGGASIRPVADLGYAQHPGRHVNDLARASIPPPVRRYPGQDAEHRRSLICTSTNISAPLSRTLIFLSSTNPPGRPTPTGSTSSLSGAPEHRLALSWFGLASRSAAGALIAFQGGARRPPRRRARRTRISLVVHTHSWAAPSAPAVQPPDANMPHSLLGSNDAGS